MINSNLIEKDVIEIINNIPFSDENLRIMFEEVSDDAKFVIVPSMINAYITYTDDNNKIELYGQLLPALPMFVLKGIYAALLLDKGEAAVEKMFMKKENI